MNIFLKNIDKRNKIIYNTYYADRYYIVWRSSTPIATKYSDIIPLWIADMDFKVPPQVEDALLELLH